MSDAREPTSSRSSASTPSPTPYRLLNEEAEERGRSCEPVPMPSLDHLTMDDYDKVYEPSDDTYLLLDAIGAAVELPDGIEKKSGMGEEGEEDRGHDQSKVESITTGRPPRRPPMTMTTTLEIGCGTGAATVCLALRLAESRRRRQRRRRPRSRPPSLTTTSDGSSCVQHYVTDVNPRALSVAVRTARANGLSLAAGGPILQPILCDLASPLLPRLAGTVDVLLFNPPYVPTPDDEVGGTSIEASWAGGTDGRVVLDRALPQIVSLLRKPDGMALVVTVDENRPEEIRDVMKRSYGLDVVPWVRRRARNEFLTVLKMTWPKDGRKEEDEANGTGPP